MSIQNMTHKTKVFIAGTDTGVGKTSVCAALLYGAQQQGLKTLGLKPVAAGAELIEGIYRNDDGVQLMKYSSVNLPYEQVNPICLREAIAPHIAAEREGKSLSMNRIAGYCRGALIGPAEFSVVEGAGGWRVPLNSRETMADLAKELELPVILVVGMRLGCLNHTLLTVEAMIRDGINLVGWVSTKLDEDMPVYQENLDAIASRLTCPLLAQVPFIKKPSAETFAKHIDIPKIMALMKP